MSVLKKLAGQTAVYGVSSIVGRMLTFFLVPFYTSRGVLNEAEFGAMTELYAYIGFLNVVYLFGMETTYFRFASNKNYSEGLAYDNSLSPVIMNSLALSGLIIITSSFLANLLRFPGKESFFILMGLILALDAIAAIP